MGSGVCDKDRKVVDDLTKVIINRTMSPLADEIRKAAETHDHEALDVAQKWFIKEGRKKRK
jgi:glutamyl-tRNA reductase